MQKITLTCFTLIISFLFSYIVNAQEFEYPSFQCNISSIDKFGNIVLNITPTEFQNAGYEHGDILSVTINGNCYSMPYGTNFTDVNIGSMILLEYHDKLCIAATKSDFASNYGIANKVNEYGKSVWKTTNNIPLNNVIIQIKMEEKFGYLDDYLIRQTKISFNRADYSSDSTFANFRNVDIGKFGKNAFFRSSTPIDDSIKRAAYADKLTSKNNIQTIINLTDNDEDLKEFIAKNGDSSPYYKTLYNAGKIKPLDLSVDFKAKDFQYGLSKGLKFLAANNGPYLIHCIEGKDRTGFVSALIECFMGATYQEIADDYMQSFINYYHLEKGTKQYEAIKNGTVPYIISEITGLNKETNFSTINLEKEAKEYIISIGLTEAEIDTLKTKLSKDYLINNIVNNKKASQNHTNN